MQGFGWEVVEGNVREMTAVIERRFVNEILWYSMH